MAGFLQVDRLLTRAALLMMLAHLVFAAGPARKATPAQPDSSIEQNIRARFAKSKIAEDKFTVRVQGGVAVIEGSTNIVQRKGVATRLAKLGGAIAVDNRIRIGDAARQKAAAKLAEHRPKAGARPNAGSSKPVASDSEPTPIPRAVVKH